MRSAYCSIIVSNLELVVQSEKSGAAGNQLHLLRPHLHLLIRTPSDPPRTSRFDLLEEFGYSNVAILDGGYPAWKKAGYDIFGGMSVEGKGFGEWITFHYQTPTMTPEQVQQRIALLRYSS